MNSLQFSILALLLSMLLSSQCFAQESRDYVLGNTHFKQVISETGKRYELVITLPSSYRPGRKNSYPVLYYLDPYWDTPALFGVYHALVYDNLIPELILVGLSYPGEKVNYGTERLRDFTPTNGPLPEGVAGNASALLKDIRQLVVPFVETNYRANKSERALAGTSFGGLFTLYAMYEDPEFFKRYIAISPSAVWDNNYLARRDTLYAAPHATIPTTRHATLNATLNAPLHALTKTLNARLFLSYGDEEYAPFRDPIRELQKQIAARNYKDLALQNYHMKDLRHASVKAEGYTHGLIWVWKDMAPSGKSGLEREFDILSKKVK